MKKKLLSLMIVLTIIFSFCSPAFADENLKLADNVLETPSDEDNSGSLPPAEPSKWAKEEIQTAANAGFVPDGLLEKPQEDITREEFASIAVPFIAKNLGYEIEEFADIVNKKTDEVLFDDTDNYNVLLAARCGIVVGVGDNKFVPLGKITREQAAAMLFRTYMTYCIGAYMSDTAYSDNDSISDWAKDAVRFCANYGVMKGYDTGAFGPKDNYTVEQSIATFVRLGDIDEWKDNNFSARFVRKMTKEEAVAEYEKLTWQQILERFETPFGTVLYTVTGGVPHAGSHSLVLVRNNGTTTGLLKDMPKADGWGKIADLEDLSFNKGDNTMTFKMTFADKAEGIDYGVLHEAGVYYYKVYLEKEECVLEKFEAAI